LQVGDPGQEITGIMVALDATPAVLDATIAACCNLLLTHHPLIFKPLTSISAATPQGRLLQAAIAARVAVVSIHTSYDTADGGLNDLLAGRLEVVDCRPLQPGTAQQLAKLVAFVPDDHLDTVRSALFPFAEQLGAYCDCTFAAAGEGTFTPLEGAKPFIGTVAVREKVREQRLELLIDRTNLARAIKALLASHPYEEPAFDIYPLLNEGKYPGLGRIGTLAEPSTLSTYAQRIRNGLAASGLRYVGDPDAIIRKVALCSGSGGSLLHNAVRAGADVLVTGDISYHHARDAEDAGIALIDAGHFATENIMADGVAERLRPLLEAAGYDACRVEACRIQTDPFRI